MKRIIKKIRINASNIMAKITISLAMSAVYLTVKDWPCLVIVGEPTIPDILLQKKKEKYGESSEDINMR